MVNQFVQLGALAGHLETFMQGLFHLTQDPDGGVRRRVWEGVNWLIEVGFSALLPHFDGVVEFMLASMADADAAVALGALEFWQYVAEAGSSGDDEQARVR